MTKKLRDHLLRNYDVPLSCSLRQDQRGMTNETWFVAGDFVVTIFRNRFPFEVAYISTVIHSDRSGLLPQIVIGQKGAVSMIDGKAAIMWRRFSGNHYVGRDHSNKTPIPESAHAYIAKSFWELHASLAEHRKVGAWLGNMEYLPPSINDGKDISFATLPACLHKDYIAEYLQTSSLPLRYPAFVHRDFERQNVLNAPDGKVTGIVDADALIMGDLLFEYAHCMTNFVFSDPQYQPRHADLYIAALKKAKAVDPDDIRLLPDLIRFFAAKDLVDYFRYDHPPRTDISRLAEIYDISLERVNRYFAGRSLSVAVRPRGFSRKAKPLTQEGV